MRIKILDPLIANQIAAGEVIERPASLIKELLENSLDAGSTDIQIDLEDGGLKLISVSDNGHGIHPDDLKLAFMRHGTSKIKSSNDLFEINSLGFRGEALASIAAVAKVKLTSCYKENAHAFEINANGSSSAEEPIPAAHPQGTTIAVRELFFNVPARKAFLKSGKTELQHIQKILAKLILSHFNVRFSLSHHKKNMWLFKEALSEEAKENRIVKLCGKNFLNQALKISLHADDIKLEGWLTQPTATENFANAQHFFINKRPVRDKTIIHAIHQAYQWIAPQTNPPGYVLYLETHPSRIDVNVHPTKNEVRFREQRLIHDFIVHAIKDSLSKITTAKPSPVAKANYFNTYQPQHSFHLHEKTRPYEILSQTLKQPANREISTDANNLDKNDPERLVIFKRYILENTQDSIIIYDTKKAIELFFEKLFLLLKDNDQQNIPEDWFNEQPILFPVSIKFPNNLIERIKNLIPLFEELNFNLDLISDTHFVIRKIPNVFLPFSIELFFNSFMALNTKKPKQDFGMLFTEAISLNHTTMVENHKSWLLFQSYLNILGITPNFYCHTYCEDKFEKLF